MGIFDNTEGVSPADAERNSKALRESMATEGRSALDRANSMDLKQYHSKTRTLVKEFMSQEQSMGSMAGMLKNIQTTPEETMGGMAAQIAERTYVAAQEAGEELPMSAVFTADGALTTALDRLFDIAVATGVLTEEQEEDIKTKSYMQSILNLTQSPNLGEAASAMAEEYDKGGRQ